MSKKTDFAVGQQQLFTTTPYSMELQRENKLKYFINAGTRTKFVLHSHCEILDYSHTLHKTNISKNKETHHKTRAISTILFLHNFLLLNQTIMKKARYIRQSTKNQTNLRQLAKAHQDETLYIDIISGSIPFAQRPEGKKLIEAIEVGEIDYLSFHAIDRCGRNTINVLQTLQYFYDKGVVVKIDNLGLESMINGKANPVFNLITTILSELSSLEKTSLHERQKEGILAARLRNPFLYKGRQEGTTDSAEVTLSKHKRTVKALKTNPTLSLRQIAKLSSESDYKVSANTVKKVKLLLDNPKVE